jgi:PTS system nitrogen regulatory IIA component
MDLKIKDIVGLLQVTEKTVYRWIKEKKKKIPCYRINHQYRFNKAEINEWILSQKIEFSSSLINLGINGGYNLSSLLQKGGIIYGIKGNTAREVLQNAVDKLSIPPDLTAEEILDALLSREELIPTSIGKGIAIPHPRSPVVTNPGNANITICFLDEQVDFHALDKQPVHILFILLTASPRMHLDVLSKISYLCQDKKFLELLNPETEKEKILGFIQVKESEWLKKGTN